VLAIPGPRQPVQACQGGQKLTAFGDAVILLAADGLVALLIRPNNLVFCHENGDPYTSDQLNWRFSKMTRKAGIGRWHAHEGRHTAVSIMSSNGVPIQEISDTVGHKSTHVTETVYRHVIVPEIRGGATVMDGISGDD
jgi:integrase